MSSRIETHLHLVDFNLTILIDVKVTELEAKVHYALKTIMRETCITPSIHILPAIIGSINYSATSRSK